MNGASDGGGVGRGVFMIVVYPMVIEGGGG